MNVSSTMYDIVYCTCRENGIKYRRDEAVGGWFSQIGEMHQVHHLWGKPIATSYNILSSSTIVVVRMYNINYCCNHSAYKDLPDRTETRRSAWEFPGWDECVVRTGEQEQNNNYSLLMSKKLNNFITPHAHTHSVPLMRHMIVRILLPTPFSPLK